MISATMGVTVMSRKTLSVASGILFLLSIIVLTWTQTIARAQSPMKTTDLADYGLVLIPPGDPNFEGLARAVLRGRRDAMFELFKPFSAVLHNMTDKSVVGYALMWEFTDERGRRRQQYSSYSEPGSLLDGGKPRGDQGTFRKGFLVGPHSYRLITPHSSIGPDSDLFESPAGGARNALLEMEVDNLSKTKDLEVSLDGAFFEDGTFVGPNRSAFFEIFRADFDAQQDLMAGIVKALSQGKTIEEISRELEGSLSSGANPQWPGPTPTEAYEYARRKYLQEFVGVRRAAGDELARGHVFNKWFRKPPRLVKPQRP